MKKKVVWLVVSCLMVAALLLASCAPAVVEEEEEKVAPPVKEGEVVVPEKEVVVPKAGADMVKWTGTKLDGTVVEKMIEKPRYGGVHVLPYATQPVAFDTAVGPYTQAWNPGPTHDELLQYDWTRGPIGTGEWMGRAGGSMMLLSVMETGSLAESWELPEPDTLVFHIRQGVHWALDPTSEASRLVGGRELTADDIVFWLRREFTSGYYSKSYPDLADMVNVANSIYISPTDPWAVVMKSKPGMAGSIFEVSDYCHIGPREVVEKYGSMNDWKNAVGTGPFILTNYVGASSLTFVRNPNYWMKDPFFPENQLPYLDGVKVLIIPDLSTRMAALRTGKIDALWPLEAEDAESLMKTNPELKWVSLHVGSSGISMRVDTKPFDDVRVRRALNMAVNQQEILDDYYDGKADLFAYPIAPFPEFVEAYVPLEQMPESVRELYEYHPDKARQLLAEAGYPDGFPTEILTLVDDVDLYSIVKEYWADIGVELKLDVKDFTIYTSLRTKRAYTQMTTGSPSGNMPFKVHKERSGAVLNYSMISDPRMDALYDADKNNYFDWAKRVQLAKDSTIWRNEAAYFVFLPTPWEYTFWQPWLKSWEGVRGGSYTSPIAYVRFIWLDQELKKVMGR